ncbi:MAG: hypothetical protein ACOY45_16010 [Pseudomonadota bacterium]
MSRTLLAAGAAFLSLAIATPALAKDGERSFTQDGVTYVYTVSQTETGRVLEGKASQGGRFRLTVENGWVRGTVGNRYVSFPAPEKAQVEVAQR